jgi:hypothetical protein
MEIDEQAERLARPAAAERASLVRRGTWEGHDLRAAALLRPFITRLKHLKPRTFRKGDGGTRLTTV